MSPAEDAKRSVRDAREAINAKFKAAFDTLEAISRIVEFTELTLKAVPNSPESEGYKAATWAAIGAALDDLVASAAPGAASKEPRRGAHQAADRPRGAYRPYPPTDLLDLGPTPTPAPAIPTPTPDPAPTQEPTLGPSPQAPAKPATRPPPTPKPKPKPMPKATLPNKPPRTDQRLFVRFSHPGHALQGVNAANAKFILAKVTGVAHDQIKAATITRSGSIAVTASPAIEEAIETALRSAEHVTTERHVPGQAYFLQGVPRHITTIDGEDVPIGKVLHDEVRSATGYNPIRVKETAGGVVVTLPEAATKSFRIFGSAWSKALKNDRPRVEQCDNCQGYSHPTVTCRGPTRCPSCGVPAKDHPFDDPRACGLPKCPNCLGPHGPRFPKCPARPQIVSGTLQRPTKAQRQAFRNLGAAERAGRTRPNPPTNSRAASPEDTSRGRPRPCSTPPAPSTPEPAAFLEAERRAKIVAPTTVEDHLLRDVALLHPRNEWDVEFSKNYKGPRPAAPELAETPVEDLKMDEAPPPPSTPTPTPTLTGNTPQSANPDKYKRDRSTSREIGSTAPLSPGRVQKPKAKGKNRDTRRSPSLSALNRDSPAPDTSKW